MTKIFKKITVILSAAALLSCSACAPLASPEKENEGNYPTEFSDVFSGFAFTVYRQGQDGFEPITSTKFGDEDCAAVCLEYVANAFSSPELKNFGLVKSEYSGKDYIRERSPQSVDLQDGKENVGVDSVIYIDRSAAENFFYRFNPLSKNEDGEIVCAENSGEFLNLSGISSTVETERIEQTIQIPSENGIKTKTLVLTLTLTVEARETGDNWKINEYSEVGELISSSQISFRDEGEFLIHPDCAFLIAEERLPSGEITRTMYERTDGTFPTISFYYGGNTPLLKEAKFIPIERASD